MKYTAKMARMIRGYDVMMAVCYGALLSALIAILAMVAGLSLKFLSLLGIWAVMTVVLVLCALVKSVFEMQSIRRQIRKQDYGVDFNDEVFEKIGKNLYLGRDWLVYRKGVLFRVYNHAFVKRTAVDRRVRNAQVRLLCDKGTEGFTVSGTGADLQARLEQWVSRTAAES